MNSWLAAERMRDFTAAHINYVGALLVLLHNPEIVGLNWFYNIAMQIIVFVPGFAFQKQNCIFTVTEPHRRKSDVRGLNTIKSDNKAVEHKAGSLGVSNAGYFKYCIYILYDYDEDCCHWSALAPQCFLCLYIWFICLFQKRNKECTL